MRNKIISIWFFIGSMLAVYGALILATGIYTVFCPPKNTVVLASLHIEIWWGTIILLLGLIFVIRFWPEAREHT